MSRSAPTTVAPPDDEARDRRRARWALAEFLHQYSTLPRVRRCSFRRSSSTSAVAIRRGEGGCHYSGLQLCGSVAACPVCGAKIREQRATEIRDGGLRWLGGDKLVLEGVGDAPATVLPAGRQRSLLFLTLTMPHDAGDRLAETFDTIAGGWRALLGGRSGQALRSDFGVLGKVAAREVTWSAANGWHPHLHVLLFVDQVLDDDSLDNLRERFLAHWRRFVTRRGYRLPHDRYGVDLRRVVTAGDLAQYLVKAGQTDGGRWGVGRELTRADVKSARSGSFSPYELLRVAADTGDADCLRLWHEYESATAGRQLLTWSAHLKGCVRIADVTDQEIAEAEQGGAVVCTFGSDLWREITRRRGLRFQLLHAAEIGGVDQVAAALRWHRVMWIGQLRPGDQNDEGPPG